MESLSSHDKRLARHTLSQMVAACDMVMVWNKGVVSIDDYLTSYDGMQKMAASCMLIESIGEGAKKIDKLIPGFLESEAPDVPWRSIKGLRDHIAHGYFNLDADIIFDVAINEIPALKGEFERLAELLG